MDKDYSSRYGHHIPEEQGERIEILIEELEKLVGFISMSWWVQRSANYLHTFDVDPQPTAFREAALANPCGTAACIAGKAGLMPRFREMGFKWEFHVNGYGEGRNGFSISPKEFFGRAVFHAVFTGTWAGDMIETPQQAALALRAFLAYAEDNQVDFLDEDEWEAWEPDDATDAEIYALMPAPGTIVFPVSVF